MPSLGDIAQRARQAIPGVQDGGNPNIDWSAPPQPTLPADPFNAPGYSLPSRLTSYFNQRFVQPPLQGLADAARLTRDVAQGKASMNDPATQQRAIGAGVNLATSMGGPAPEGALGIGMPMNFGEMNNEMLQAFHNSHNSKILSVINTIQMIENFGRGIAAEHPGWNEYLGKLARPDLMSLQGKYERMFDQLISRRDTARAELRRRGLWK